MQNCKPRDFDFLPFQVQARPYLNQDGELRIVDAAAPSPKQTEAERKAEQQVRDGDELVRAIQANLKIAYRPLKELVGLSSIKHIKQLAHSRGWVKEGETWVRLECSQEQCSGTVFTPCS